MRLATAHIDKPMKNRYFATLVVLTASLSLTAQSLINQVNTLTTGYTSYIYTIDDDGVKSSLIDAPSLSEAGRAAGVTITLPDPSGNPLELQAYESPIMAPELAERFPNIKTYKVKGKGVSGRIGYTDKGFHAILFTTNGTLYIDPIGNEAQTYHTYNRKDYVEFYKHTKDHQCLLDDSGQSGPAEVEMARGERQSGEILRTYRLALACTGEYASFHGGTTSGVLSAMVVSMNRINGVYEREFSITMQLIGNNDDLIFLNAATDPYQNNSPGQMINVNANVLNSLVGSSSYDIGHVFSTGGGGLAGLGVVCGGSKASGVTGINSPTGDPFDIDYVSHEMGHQFGGPHSYNGSAGSCSSNASFSSSDRLEPGSGSTIMAYAGICSPQNLQNNSDDYFNAGSYNSMGQYAFNGGGNGCSQQSSTGNTAPEVAIDPASYSIPKETPFVLRGSASDNEGDDLSYCWEEIDFGPQGNPQSPSLNAPIFRSWDPVDHGERTFPRLISVLTGSLAYGEIYPTYSRDLNFRLTVRDNNIAGGGVAYDKVSMEVDGNKGPFIVTSPPTGGQAQSGVYYQVEWDVAGTDQSPINCQSVHILLYDNNGLTLSDTLAADVPNTGSAFVLMANNLGGGNRVRVEAADNVFFNYNPGVFSIVNPLAPVGNDIVLSVAPQFPTGSIDLSWNDPFTNENEWVIERSVGGNGSFTPIDTVAFNSTTYSDPNVSMLGTEYYYRVFAINPAGSSALSNEDSWSGVGVDEPSSSGLVLYPNPVSDALHIGLSLDQRIAKLTILDELGRTVTVQTETTDRTIDVQILPSGSYFLQVELSDGSTLIEAFNIAR